MKSYPSHQLRARRALGKICTLALVLTAGCGGGGDLSVASPPPVSVVPAIGEMTLLAGTVGGAGDTDGAPGRFNQPTALATDASGNVYVADTANHTIRKITAAGVITLAGKAGVSGFADGVGGAALFNLPVGVAVDAASNVYVADHRNAVIRKITPTGSVTTLAGTVGNSSSIDGLGTAAQFSMLKGVAIDANGIVFVAEETQVRKLTPAGLVTTLAAGFSGLSALTVDHTGNVYAVDSGASLIKKITPSGAVTTFAGTIATSNGIAPFGFADGSLGTAKFDHPAGITAHTEGTLYVLDNTRIRRVTVDGVVTSLPINKSDGTRFIFPGISTAGLAIAADGNIFVAAPADNLIRKVSPNLSVVDIAGTPVVSGTADGAGATARFSGPGDLAVDASGNIIVIDALNNAIRRITSSGLVTTVVSAVRDPSIRLAPGINFSSAFLLGLAIDKSGALLVADPNLHLIYRIDVDGTKTVVAGTGWPDGVSSGGFFPVVSGRSKPLGVAVDSAGILFVPDGAIIRKVMAGGIDSMLACTNMPTCVAAGKLVEAITVDKADNIYAAQAGVIFKITPTGASSILAGGSTMKFADGTGESASFGSVQALATDAAGNVFVADTSNNAVRKISPTGMVTTIAGKAGAVGAVPGVLPSSLSAPAGISIDAAGLLYVSTENAVLKIKP